MIAIWMLYSATVATLAGIAAAALEPVLRQWRRPARLAWALALLATVLVPMALVVRPLVGPAGEGSVVAGPLVPLAPLDPLAAAEPGALDHLRRAAAGVLADSAARLGAFDRPLLAGWLALSTLAALALATSAVRLRRRRRAWTPATVDGVPVLVAPDAGPAVMGSGAHRIVLPSWALALDAPLRALVLRHEQEHLRAGDPRLLLAGVAALVLMPWSPAVWWQVRRLRLAVELDCDRRVLGAAGDVERYGLLLLAVSQRGGGMLRLAMPALSEGATDLERRIAVMTAPPPRRRRARAASLLTVAASVVAVACVVPSPNAVSGPEAPAPRPTPTARADAPPQPTVVQPGQTFFEFQVEQPAAPLNNVAPQYPADLRAAGVSGQVIAQFVVDTTGRADVRTYKVIESADERFSAAVFNVLPAMQFTAAEIGGHKVKQLVQQAFAFNLATPLRAPPPARRDTMREFTVEEPARAIAPATPTYPAELRAQNLRGEVIAQVVVDDTGAPMMPTFRVVRSDHALFTAAAREAVAATRFSPARVEGRAVRQLIQQAFVFTPDR